MCDIYYIQAKYLKQFLIFNLSWLKWFKTQVLGFSLYCQKIGIVKVHFWPYRYKHTNSVGLNIGPQVTIWTFFEGQVTKYVLYVVKGT